MDLTIVVSIAIINVTILVIAVLYYLSLREPETEQTAQEPPLDIPVDDPNTTAISTLEPRTAKERHAAHIGSGGAFVSKVGFRRQ